MDEQELRKHVLGAKKTERIIFATTPEMKEALETIAQEQSVSRFHSARSVICKTFPWSWRAA